MFFKISRAMKSRKGFTLVELMVVVVIIGVLVAIAVPVYNNVTVNANKSAVEANLRTIDSAIMMRASAGLGTATAISDLVPGYLAAAPSGPTGVTSYGISGGRGVVTIPANTFGTHAAAAAVNLDALQVLTGW